MSSRCRKILGAKFFMEIFSKTKAGENQNIYLKTYINKKARVII
jgi:hypothetical protein